MAGRPLNTQEKLLYCLHVLEPSPGTLVAEGRIHDLAITARDVLGLDLRFIEDPCVYSSTVDSQLRALWRKGDIDMSFTVDELDVPEYFYGLTLYGQARLVQIEDWMWREYAEAYERLPELASNDRFEARERRWLEDTVAFIDALC